jgi:signal peptidase I
MLPKFQNVANKREIKEYWFPSFWHEIKDYTFYFLKTVIIISVVYLFIRSSIFEKVGVNGQSMFPTYNATQNSLDEIYINKISPKFQTFKRGQVVVLISPPDCVEDKELFIKRIIGLPGETLSFENGDVKISNSSYPEPGIKLDEKDYLKPEVRTYKNISIPDQSNTVEKILDKNEYFVMGDNRTGSNDSRRCGAVRGDQIIGEEVFRISPEIKKGFFKLPKYNIGNQND